MAEEDRMKIETTFEIKEKISFLRRTKEYFLQYNFIILDEDTIKNTISFKKGSVFKNAFVTNPLNLQSQIDISLQNMTANIVYNLNTQQVITSPKDIAVWNTLIENYKTYVLHYKNEAEILEEKIKDTKKQTNQIILYIVIISFICSIPISFIAVKTGFIIMPIEIIILFAVFYYVKKNK
ncbi:MAG: hypothetical protein H6553_12025 [Chitinophagales bacterium]|nr:hypothetical protein [Chitinophagales bacterium]